MDDLLQLLSVNIKFIFIQCKLISYVNAANHNSSTRERNTFFFSNY